MIRAGPLGFSGGPLFLGLRATPVTSTERFVIPYRISVASRKERQKGRE